MRVTNTIILVVLPMLLMSGSAFSQWVVAEQQTVAYSQGIGRVAWTRPKDLKAIFAVPHFTSGPRIKCSGELYECDIEVLPRDIAITQDARMRELEAATDLHRTLQNASDGSLKISAYGKNKDVIYSMVRGGAPQRLRAFGYALRGTAVIKFDAIITNTSDLSLILDLVDAARTVDSLGMWALKFGDYKAACDKRFPAYSDVNERAFLASPFAKVDLILFFMNQDPSLSERAVRDGLKRVRESYLQSFDSERQDQQSFCEGFPRWIAEASKDVQVK